MAATTNEKILNALSLYNTGLQTKLNAKFVAKDGDKVLSTNDFTDAYKAKLDGLAGGGISIAVGTSPPESGIWIDTSNYGG